MHKHVGEELKRLEFGAIYVVKSKPIVEHRNKKISSQKDGNVNE